MWRPLHKCPSFATPRKRQRVEEEEAPSAFLNAPVTKKLNCENVTINGCEIGHASMQGYRVSMEDEHIIEGFELKDHTLVAIMDGKRSSNFTVLFVCNMFLIASSARTYQ